MSCKHGISKRKLGMETSHRMATLRNLATSLIEHEKVKTTLVKAKELRPFVEKIVTLAKRNGLANRRKAASVLYGDKALDKLFNIIAPKLATRKGGYLRILKIGYRHGDCADMAIIEFVDDLNDVTNN